MSYYSNDDDCQLSHIEREDLISGYSELIRQRRDMGFVPYYMNFMFSQLPGNRNTKKEIMKREVRRAHDILTRHIVRDRTSSSAKPVLPLFLGCFDLPVLKIKKKNPIRDVSVNDGLHFNGIALVPPSRKSNADFSLPKNAIRSSWEGKLQRHITAHPELFLTDHLDRIYVRKIAIGTMADYTFKCFKNGSFSADDILVL